MTSFRLVLLAAASTRSNAARIVRSFETWKRFDNNRQAHARAALERVLAAAKSTNLKEVITKTLRG